MICIYVIKYIYIILYWILHISPSKMFDITIHISTFWLVPSTPPLGVPPLIHWVPHRLPKTRRTAAGATQQQQGGGLARKVGA